jgi:hypothetical protein
VGIICPLFTTVQDVVADAARIEHGFLTNQ